MAAQQNNSDIKKFLPFLVPIVIIVAMILLAWNWYRNQVKLEAETPATTSKIEIESLSEEDEEWSSLAMRGEGEYQTVKMNPVEALSGTMAELRYEVKEDKVLATVVANLGELGAGEQYQLWIKPSGADEWQVSGLLELKKSGYVASLAVKTEYLPIEVKVSKENAVASASQDLFMTTLELAEETL